MITPTTFGKVPVGGEFYAPDYDSRSGVRPYKKLAAGPHENLDDNVKFPRGDGSYGDCLWYDHEKCTVIR